MTRKDRYRRSAALFERALAVIPGGTQTFSKSALQFPVGAAPHFLTDGRGGRVRDVDGNEYVDLMAGLLPVLLGYRDPDVDAAIRDQLERGISFSLATELEVALADELVALIPCAEMVRFGKTGSDATTAAIRLARSHTGRDHVLACGYHGWHDWYIGATVRDSGVPAAVRALTHKVPYNDIAAIEREFEAHPGQVAALIMEPMGIVDPAPGFLEDVRELAHRHGALLVFDEVITGFRFAAGGAQSLFGVTPDLACFGKALGNGMPISALTGRRDIMLGLTDVFFSGTFGGEALSLAAALAVIGKIGREPVIETLWRSGERLRAALDDAIAAHGLDGVLALHGKAPWQVLSYQDHRHAGSAEMKTFVVVELLERGVLTTGSHNMMYAHTDADLDHVITAYGEVLALLAAELETPGLAQRLGVDLVQPVFAVR